MKTAIPIGRIFSYAKIPFKTFIALLLIFIISCEPVDDYVEDINNPPNSGENPTQTPINTFNLSTETSNVMTQQVIKLFSNNMTFTNEKYSGTFGEVAIDLIKDSGNNLIFLIPDVQPGDYQVKLPAHGKEGKVTIKVINNNITDTQATLKYELEDPLLLLSKDVELMNSEIGLSENTRKSLASAKKMYSEFSKKLLSISGNEKAAMAKFFKANPILSSNIEEGYASLFRAGEADFDCFKESSISFS